MNEIKKLFQGKISDRLIGRALLIMFVFCLLLVATVVYLLVQRNGISSHISRFGLENIGELSTQAGYFTSVQTIQNSRDILGVDIPLTEKKLIYSYDGVIKAGIDFKDVLLDVDDAHKVIQITLPEAQIFSVEVDPESLIIYHEGTNIFNSLSLSEVNLSEKNMQAEIRDRAVENGLLENATYNAELVIRGFLSGVYNTQEYTLEFEQENGQ
ncbi:MAG: DUF4230 domain-containing protein [Clostridia bacterium]|nr:DUF4230 domain-containing protein [Clostridia bacterium]